MRAAMSASTPGRSGMSKCRRSSRPSRSSWRSSTLDSARESMLPPQTGGADAPCRRSAPGRPGSAASAGGAGALGHHLGAFGEQGDRLFHRAFRHHQHLDAVFAQDAEAASRRRRARRCPRRWSAPPTETGWPARRCAMAGVGLDLDAVDRRCPGAVRRPRGDSRRSSPPPPIGMTSTSISGASSSISSASVPWPAMTPGSS